MGGLKGMLILGGWVGRKVCVSALGGGVSEKVCSLFRRTSVLDGWMAE